MSGTSKIPSFGTPKAQIVVLLNSHLTQDLNGLSSARLYAAYISDQLNEDLYPAIMAGLNYRISANEQGISVLISGYSQKQEILLQKYCRPLIPRAGMMNDLD